LVSIIPGLYFEEAISTLAAATAAAASVFLLFLPDHAGTFMYVDGLSKVMLLSVSLVYLGTVLYSISFLKYIENPLFQKRTFYFLLNAFVFTMLFTVSVANLGLVWVGIEATTVTSALLVATDNDETAVEASWRYVIIVSAGLVISLIATIFLYKASDTLDIAALLASHPTALAVRLGVLLGIVGYGTKAGVFPMNTWLPDVHGKAPSPVSAIFSGVLLPVAMYAIMRLFQIGSDPGLRTFALTLGMLSLGTAAFFMAAQKDYKRLFAYSTIENMGVILIGISVGGIAAVGAVVILVAHAFAKSSMFFLSGNLLSRYKTTDIAGVGGVRNRMPTTGYSLFFGSLAITGAPPFGIFAGEVMIVGALFADGKIVLAIAILLLLVLAFLAVNSRVIRMVFSPSEGESMERGKLGTLVPLVFIVLSAVTILFIPEIGALVRGVFGL
jgi:hydrogenase-4 component F